MLTDFELLIQELESEKIRLNEELKECLLSYDYKYAHYFQKGIWRVDRKIKRLKQLYQNPQALDTQYLADAIIELDQDKIHSFSLHFFRNSDFYLRFNKLPDGKLYCHIPSENEMRMAGDYFFYSFIEKNILALGFDFNEEKAGITFTIESNLSCNLILTKLAVLMFDILHIRTDAGGYITKQFQE